MNSDLQLALELCDVADAVTMSQFRALDLVVEAKPDLTPVTEADRQAEQVLRDRLLKARPHHSLLGEEFGHAGPRESEWCWLVDPIDGTKNYVRGVPVFATLMALQHNGNTVVGVVSAPALGRRWWAARGEGAFANGQPIRVSAVSAVEDASVSYDEFLAFERLGSAGAFAHLARRCWRARSYSDFWAHTLVAEGAVDIAIYAESGLKAWDVAPLQLLVDEAGGRFSALSGADWCHGDSAVSTNGFLHDEVLSTFNP